MSARSGRNFSACEVLRTSGKPTDEGYWTFDTRRVDTEGVKLVTKPLFSVDPGWLFVLAGLALLVSGALVPGQRDLHDLRDQLRQVKDRETESYSRLRAYSTFMEDLRARDPVLVKRLAAAQLNQMPSGGTPVLAAESLDAGVTDWIEATVEFMPTPSAVYPDTLLTRLATGPRRLWLLAGGAMCVFAGLLLGPSISAPVGSRQGAARRSVAGLLEAPPVEARSRLTADDSSNDTEAFHADDGGLTEPRFYETEVCVEPTTGASACRESEVDLTVIDAVIVPDTLVAEVAALNVTPGASDVPDSQLPEIEPDPVALEIALLNEELDRGGSGGDCVVESPALPQATFTDLPLFDDSAPTAPSDEEAATTAATSEDEQLDAALSCEAEVAALTEFIEGQRRPAEM